MTEYSPQLAAKKINAKRSDFTPKTAIILGSGLSSLADALTRPVVMDYGDIPGFPKEQVDGHPGKLIMGYYHEEPVICLQGRAHLYQGMDYQQTIKLMIRTLYCLGCETLLVTNASGAITQSINPGDIVMIYDHINFQLTNPLIGSNDEHFGPRFIGMDNVYDEKLRNRFLHCANMTGVDLHQGIYIATLGPMFETPAEIRAFRILGADIVGMSTVPEVIVAHHCGINVAALSAVTNKAAGIGDEPLSHELTMRGAEYSKSKMLQLVDYFFRSRAEQ